MVLHDILATSDNLIKMKSIIFYHFVIVNKQSIWFPISNHYQNGYLSARLADFEQDIVGVQFLPID